MRKINNKVIDGRDTTIGELLHMRSVLNAAFAEKIGRTPDAGFSIEFGECYDGRMSFSGGYEDFKSNKGALVYSYVTFDTPIEAFNHTMRKIKELPDRPTSPTKEEKIAELQSQIEALKND